MNQKITESVLHRWSKSLLSINHWLKQFKSSVKSCSISCLFCLTLRCLSHQRIKVAWFWQQQTCHWRKLKIKEVLTLALGGFHRWWENTMSESQINLLIVFYRKDMIWTKSISLPRPETSSFKSMLNELSLNMLKNYFLIQIEIHKLIK